MLPSSCSHFSFAGARVRPSIIKSRLGWISRRPTVHAYLPTDPVSGNVTESWKWTPVRSVRPAISRLGWVVALRADAPSIADKRKSDAPAHRYQPCTTPRVPGWPLELSNVRFSPTSNIARLNRARHVIATLRDGAIAIVAAAVWEQRRRARLNAWPCAWSSVVLMSSADSTSGGLCRDWRYNRLRRVPYLQGPFQCRHQRPSLRRE